MLRWLLMAEVTNGVETRRIQAALDAVESSVHDQPERAYFLMHRTRYELVLQTVCALGRGRRLKVLDIGCFPYHVTPALELLGNDVCGISSEHEPLGKGTVVTVNIEEDCFPFDDGAFDLVLFNEVLEHLPQSPMPALTEMLRVTRHGGRLMITTPNIARSSNRLRLLLGGSIMYPVDAYFEDGGRGNNRYYRHNREYTLQEVRRVVTAAGWRVAEARRTISYKPFTPRMVPDPWRSEQPSGGRKLARLLSYLSKVACPPLRDTLHVLAVKP